MRSIAISAVMACILAGCSATTTPPELRTATPLEHLPALAGDYFPIRSAATGGLYHIYIRLPEDYASSPGRAYPTVYLLDGDSLFPLLAPHHLFLTYDDKLPEAVLIGIAFGSFAPPVNRRDVDFGRGAESFHRFLKSELVPAVERRVRAAGDRRILVGQSRGAGFVLYSAFKDPALFWGRIASNPSFPDHRRLLMVPPAPARDDRAIDRRLVVVSGTRDRPQLRHDALAWFAVQEGRPAPWVLKRIDLEGGTHAADMPNAYRRAMNWLFEASGGDR